jgi:hypothetical protein
MESRNRANQSFGLENSSCCHSAGAPATEESVFPYSRSQILQSLGLHQDDASLLKSTHLETLTRPESRNLTADTGVDWS